MRLRADRFTVAISYAAEVCPVALRGYLTSYGNFCWGWGQLVGIGVIKSQFGRTDQWAYRIPYGLMVRGDILFFPDVKLTQDLVDVLSSLDYWYLLCSSTVAGVSIVGATLPLKNLILEGFNFSPLNTSLTLTP